ncbi:MAG: hypothetical protein ACM34K_05735 [Bacillota bacterium]
MEVIVYNIPLEGLRDFIEKVNSSDILNTNTAEAVSEAADYFISQWIQTASEKLKHTSGWYAQGIQDGKKYPFNNNPLEATIIHTDKRANYLEQGYESFDMKKALSTSSKVRISKDGKRYLIIPFRHGHPDSLKNPMPKDVYQKASQLSFSQITGIRYEGSQQKNGPVTFQDAQLLKRHNPEKVKRNEYNWGDRLTGLKVSEKITMPSGEVRFYQPYKTSKYEGMVRFQSNPGLNRQSSKSTGKFINTTDNNKNYSEYITFRVMKEDSEGWFHPGIKAMNILSQTVQREKQTIINIIANGVEKDMKQLSFGTNY